jgi:hypothetical protein
MSADEAMCLGNTISRHEYDTNQDKTAQVAICGSIARSDGEE